MNSFFGVELPTAVNFVLAFVVVLVLIGVAAWLVRRFGATSLDAASRGRQPRLAVIDSATVDNRRRLVIIRRDNVEHLLMIGGPTDVVVETNIVRSAAAREPAPARAGNGDQARALPIPDSGTWPLQPEPVLAPVQAAPSLRSTRPTPDEVSQWQSPPMEPAVSPPPLRAARPADMLAGLAQELTPASESAPMPRMVEPAPPVQAVAPIPQAPPAVDQSLAEMAQRLEAALRRPAPARMAVEGSPRAGGAERAARSEPRGAPLKAAAQSKPQPATNSGDLEQEMASLIGRPGKT